MAIHCEAGSEYCKREEMSILNWLTRRRVVRDPDLDDAWKRLLKLQGKTQTDSGRISIDEDTGEVIVKREPCEAAWKAQSRE